MADSGKQASENTKFSVYFSSFPVMSVFRCAAGFVWRSTHQLRDKNPLTPSGGANYLPVTIFVVSSGQNEQVVVMKLKGQVPKTSIRDREFERLLRRASEITTVQRPPLKMRPSLRRTSSIA